MKTCLIVPALALAMAISLTMTHDTSAGRPTQEPTGGLSDDERAALADLESSDRFRNIAQGTKQLSVERAREYVEYTERRARSFYGLTRLELSNVSEISDKTAKELAKHRGWLFLNGLTSISDAGAEALSQHHGRLYLNGLKTLSDEAAKSLAQHGLVPHRENDLTVKGAGLHLDGLTTLSDEAARALAQQKGELWLRGLTTLSDEAAAVLRQKRDIRLPVNFRGEKNEAANSRKPSHRTYVYAKIILPIKSPAKGEHPAVESWIAKKLRRRGETEFRAVTNWVRLAEGGEGDSDIWAATADGKNWGCPVSGRISERTADGKVKVELSGWSPVAVAKIKGGTLAAETGSRTIATVDTGIDQDGRAFVALVVGPGKATHDHAKKNLAAIPWSEFSSAKLKQLRSQNKRILVYCRADWDLNCKLLDRWLFTDWRVINAVKRLEYTPLRADCTNRPNEELNGYLQEVGWHGNASIVVYRPENKEHVVLQLNKDRRDISVGELLDAMKPGGKAEK